MRIACVHCGDRSNAEFTYLGDAGPRRPVNAARDIAAMYDYVYMRDNPPGLLREFWQHSGGCRAWLVVERNVSTHEIVSVRAARERGVGGEPASRAREAIR